MTSVPQYNNKPLKPIYNPVNVTALASLKQRSLIDTLCRRRKVTPPNMTRMTKGQAAELISRMLDR